MSLTHAGPHRGHLFRVPHFNPLAIVRSWSAARLRRRRADRRIASGFPVGRDLAWRVAELTSPDERRLLARSVRDILDELSAATLPGASPLNRPTLRPHAAALAALADRLACLERPVTAAGVLAVHRLLTDPDSVLFSWPSPDEPPRHIGAELGAIPDRLEVRP